MKQKLHVWEFPKTLTLFLFELLLIFSRRNRHIIYLTYSKNKNNSFNEGRICIKGLKNLLTFFAGYISKDFNFKLQKILDLQ